MLTPEEVMSNGDKVLFKKYVFVQTPSGHFSGKGFPFISELKVIPQLLLVTSFISILLSSGKTICNSLVVPSPKESTSFIVLIILFVSESTCIIL